MRTSLSSILILSLAAALAPRSAAADDAAERRSAARWAVQPFVTAVDAAKTHGFFDAAFDPDVAVCRAAVKDGTAAGWKPLETFEWEKGVVMWKSVGAICDEYARLRPMKAAIEAVGEPYRTIVVIRGSDGEGHAGMRGDVYRGHAETAKACVAAVDQAIAHGAPADVKFSPQHVYDDQLLSLAEVRQQCHDFIAWTMKAGAAEDAARAAEEAALRAKYARHGITGDRLKYLMETDNRIYVMGKGCKTLDLAGKKKAPVIYEMQEADTYWVVYKMTFKGDKLVKTTEKRFNKLLGTGWSCQ